MVNKIKNKIRLFFGCTARETNGLLVLIPILFIILFTPVIYKRYLITSTANSEIEDQRLLQAWHEESKSKLKKKIRTPLLTSTFDPNQLTEREWIARGFKNSTAKRIIKYLDNGGRFYENEDVLKIYGIDKKLVGRYSSYMEISKMVNYKTTESKKVISVKPAAKGSPEVFEKINLNIADSLQLKSIRGIGPILASRVIKYRKALGGFIHLDQLKEVYGLKSEVIQRLVLKFELTNPEPSPLSINEEDAPSLARHPYISLRVSQAIVKYRIQHGDYQTVDELKKIHIINDSIFNRIAPYITLASSE